MKQAILAILVVFALAACQHEGVPPPAPVTTAPAEPAQTSNSKRLHLEPAALSSCEQGSAVTVDWDGTDLAGNQDLQLWVVDDGQEKLFAAGGATGTATTGMWSRPGTKFRLKSAQDGTVVAEAAVSGPSC